MYKKLITKLILIFILFLNYNSVFAQNNEAEYTIILKNGNTYAVNDYWKENDKIFFEIYGGKVGFEKDKIAKIEKNQNKREVKKETINKSEHKKFQNKRGAGKTPDESQKGYNRKFRFDGFEWQILNTHKLRSVGRKGNLQYPKNDCFIVVEAMLKNISSEPRYYGDFILLSNTKQYEDSATVSVYGEYNFGYECKDTTKFEPGSNLKTFFGFDARSFNRYTMLIEEWGAGDSRKKIVLTF